MRKTILFILILALPTYLLSDENENQEKAKEIGQAAKEGKTSSATIAWAVFGVVFLVTIGVIAAVAISRDTKDTVIIVQQ